MSKKSGGETGGSMRIHAVLTLTVLGVALSLGMSSLAAKADAQQDQQACMQDAQVVCGQFIPDRERVAHCLIANRRKVSPACRAALKHFK
ncbi:MAG: hypothetical protein WB760_06950 [Xanthobacteraceae bacterium]